MSCYLKGKDKILTRLKRMEGQVRGIQRMVQQGKYCIDILTQLSSVMAASQKLGLIVLENHIQGCVRDAMSHKRDNASAEELVKVVQEFVKS
jgi:DNA-binding FrmR family transcriptional regulator